MWRQKLTAHLETWRPYTSFYVGLLALASAVIWRGQLLPLPVAVLVFVAPTLGWLAGLYGCDYFDRDLDKFQKEHRPLPSGRIKAREAFMCMMLCMYLGFVASAWLSFLNLLLAGVVMAAAVAYTIVKAHAFLGNLSRGIPGGLTALFGVVAAAGGVFPTTRVMIIFVLPALFFLHDVTTNLVGAIRDVEGDRAGHYITVPVKYGVGRAVKLALGLTCLWELLAGLLPVLVPLRTGDFYIMYVPALALAILALVLLTYRAQDRRSALLAHKYFVAERVLLAGAMLAGAIGVLQALLIVVPLLALTLWSQLSLRDRHEFGRALVASLQTALEEAQR